MKVDWYNIKKVTSQLARNPIWMRPQNRILENEKTTNSGFVDL